MEDKKEKPRSGHDPKRGKRKEWNKAYLLEFFRCCVVEDGDDDDGTTDGVSARHRRLSIQDFDLGVICQPVIDLSIKQVAEVAPW